MNCPNCGVPLMGGMSICPKCKYDIREKDGGAAFAQRKIEKAQQIEEEKIERQRKLEEKKEAIKRFSGEFRGSPEITYHIDGARGRSIDIYPFKCVIKTGVTIGSVLTHNATDGEKTIYYQDCVGLQVKYPGLTIGYIQFETASSTQNNSASNFFNENTFTYEVTQISADEMEIIVDYIKGQFDKIKEAERNSWMK